MSPSFSSPPPPPRRAPRASGVLCGVALGVVLGACSKKDDPAPAPAASVLAPSTAEPASGAKTYLVDPRGTASIDMPAPKEHIKAEAHVFGGQLEIDPLDLTKTRGEVKVDLATLETKTFGDARDATQTAHARTWLEVADGEKGKLPDDVKAQHRWATFAVRAIEAAGPAKLADLPATKDGDAEVRKLDVVAKGELLVHGHKVERAVPLALELRGKAGASAPDVVVVRTREPFKILLAEHDVKPRDDLGKLAKGAFGLLGTKVAEEATVALELRAAPKPSR